MAFANDIDPDKQVMYEANFGKMHFTLGDIHKLNAADLPHCDLFTASFPCNDLSIAGAMKGLHGKCFARSCDRGSRNCIPISRSFAVDA